MAINPTDSAFPGTTGAGINVRTYLAAAALSGVMARNTGFSGVDAEHLVKAVDLLIAELNKGSLSIGQTPSVGPASTNPGKLNTGGGFTVDRR
jgi:hypothetical protein